METLVTGTPGAGKTLLAVGTLLLPLWDASTGDWKPVRGANDDGVIVEVPRKVYTNIKGFQLEHDLVEAGAEWEYVAEKWTQKGDNKQGLHNWHEWAKPGSLIVVDEFQRIWPKRANGARVPPDISAMDTHRHMGVDFILITQKFDFDAHIAGLIGRHLHVRRVANLPFAIVYEWDHASKSLLYSKALSKSPHRHNKRVYQLYKSADLHTTQPRKIPSLVYVIAAALALAAWKIPESWARITGKADQAAATSKAHAQSKGKVAPLPVAPASSPAVPVGVPVVPASVPGTSVAAPGANARRNWAGCIVLGPRCQCFDEDGYKVETDRQTCQDGAEHVSSVAFGDRRQTNVIAAHRPEPAASEPEPYKFIGPYSGPMLRAKEPVSVLGQGGG